MSVFSDADVDAFARAQLGLSIAQVPPKVYVTQLKSFLTSYPNDTNFSAERQPGKGFGKVLCNESGCNGVVVNLTRDPLARNGGKDTGFGTFRAYQTHIQASNVHVMSRQQRIKAQASTNKTSVRSSSPVKSQTRKGTTASSSSSKTFLSKITRTMSGERFHASSSSSSAPLLAKRSAPEDLPGRSLSKKVKTEDVTESSPVRQALSQRTNVSKPRSVPMTTVHKPIHSSTAMPPVGAQALTPQTRMAALREITTARASIQVYEQELDQLFSSGHPTDEMVNLYQDAIDDLKSVIKQKESIAFALSPVKAEPSSSAIHATAPRPFAVKKEEHPVPALSFGQPAASASASARHIPAPRPFIVKKEEYPTAVAGPSRAQFVAPVVYPGHASYGPTILPKVDPHSLSDVMYQMGQGKMDLDTSDSEHEVDMPIPMPVPVAYPVAAMPVGKCMDEFIIAAGNAESFEHDVTIHDALAQLKLKDLHVHFPGMSISLMAHQVLGVAWMAKQEGSRNKGGIMADEMGLGKTVQMMATICRNPAKTFATGKGVLIIAPVALLEQWSEEIKTKTTKGYNILIYHGGSRPKGANAVAALKGCDIVITTYGCISAEWPESQDWKDRQAKKRKNAKRKAGVDDFIDDEDDEDAKKGKGKGKGKKAPSIASPLFEIQWHRVILDEAQNIRNKLTRVSNAVCDLQADYRWCLTGTPITNGLADAYGLIRFLKIRPWHDWTEFNDSVARFEQKNPTLATQRLQVIFKACLMRRKKNSMLDGQPLIQLPPKTYHLDEIAFTAEEQEIYNFLQARSRAIFNKFLRQGTVLKNYSQVLVLLLRLRQCAVHPSLIAEYEDAFLREGEIRENGEDRANAVNEIMRAESILGLPWVKDVKANLLKVALERMEAEKESKDAVISEECPICFEVLTDASITPCKHVFCTECINNVFATPVPEDGANAAPLAADERPCPSCRGRLCKNKMFIREAFMPTDVELGIVDPDDVKLEADAGPSGKKFKSKLLDDSEEEEDSDYEGQLAAEKARKKKQPRRSGRAAKVEYDVDSDDSMDDFIIEDDESESEKNARRKAKRKTKSKGKGKMRIESDDEEFQSSEAEEAQEDEEQEEGGINLTKYDYLATIGLSDSVRKPPMMAKFLPSTKMKRMMEILEDIRQNNPDDKVIVISQWTSALELCAGYLAERGFMYVDYKGSMNRYQREGAVRGLMTEDNVKVMLMSLKAGGVGLNLVRANHVISLDFAWSEAVEAQAFDRTHRLGQTKPVHIHRLAIQNTVEGKVIALQEKKKGLADGSLGEGNAKLGRMSVRELAGLFGLNARGEVIE